MKKFNIQAHQQKHKKIFIIITTAREPIIITAALTMATAITITVIVRTVARRLLSLISFDSFNGDINNNKKFMANTNGLSSFAQRKLIVSVIWDVDSRIFSTANGCSALNFQLVPSFQLI